MRKTVRSLLVADGPLAALVPPERWFAPGGVTDVPRKPFVVLRWISPVAGAARGTFGYQLRVDVHDERGSYDRIEQILGHPFSATGIHPVLASISGLTGSDGYIAEADYLGGSGDQEDPDYGSNYKFSSWQIVGRPA